MSECEFEGMVYNPNTGIQRLTKRVSEAKLDIEKLKQQHSEEKRILHNMLNMERKKNEDLRRQIDETSQALIDKADRDASSDPYMYETKRAYFHGVSEGLNAFRHSVGLKDDLDKEMEDKHA